MGNLFSAKKVKSFPKSGVFVIPVSPIDDHQIGDFIVSQDQKCYTPRTPGCFVLWSQAKLKDHTITETIFETNDKEEKEQFFGKDLSKLISEKKVILYSLSKVSKHVKELFKMNEQSPKLFHLKDLNNNIVWLVTDVVKEFSQRDDDGILAWKGIRFKLNEQNKLVLC